MGIISLVLNKFKERKKYQQWIDNWRSRNSHNHTTLSLINIPDSINIHDIITVGKGTYGNIDVRWFWNKEEKMSIGNYCSIAEGVLFLTGGNHPLDTLSSYPFDHYYDTGVSYKAPTKGPIVVEDDVWIGLNAIILSGVTIGQGAVIGAGSVVAKDVPPYAIFVGNKVVKYRFNDDTIEKLLKFDYSSLTEDEIVKNHQLLKAEIDEDFLKRSFIIIT